MDYETAYIGAAAAASKQKTAAPAQKRRAVPAVPLTKERRRRGIGRPTGLSPCADAAYGFLKIRFLPHFAGQAVQDCRKEQQQFYRCFSLMCRHYGIAAVDTSGLVYPYGREVSLYEADRLLQEKFHFHISLEWEMENGDYALNATERFDMQNTLFFIPVLPLHQMMKDSKRRKAARLLLCIFSCLYKKAGVPYYWDEDTYLYWHYDMLCQWVTDDPEGWDDDFDCCNSQANTAQYIGEQMLRRLYNNVHQQNFEKWLCEFRPQDAFDRECCSLAQRFYELWQDFPESDIYRHADTECLPNPEQYDDTDCITMEKYISFVCSTEGWLYNQLEQAVNSDFNECGSMQEPVLRRCFDGKEQHADNLDYECRLFPLINELCFVLNNLSHER
jgi:hypothetical protein